VRNFVLVTLGGVDGTIDLIRLDPFSQFQKACTPRIPVLPGYAAVMTSRSSFNPAFEDFQSPCALIARHRRTALATTQVDAQLENSLGSCKTSFRPSRLRHDRERINNPSLHRIVEKRIITLVCPCVTVPNYNAA
jgi:hypothetical protein